MMHPQTKPHAIAFPFPAQGHINPMMQLSKALARRGFTITFLNIHFVHQRLLNVHQAAPQNEDLSNHDIHLAKISDGLPLDFNRRGNYPRFLASLNAIGPAFQEFVLSLQPPVNCIISDSFLPFTQDVASKLNIPRVFFWTQSAAVYSIYAQTDHLRSRGYDPFKEIFVGKNSYEETAELLSSLPGLPPLHFGDLPYDIRNLDPSNDWASDIIQNQFLRRTEADWIIANTFYELESKVIDALQKDGPPFYPVGPLLLQNENGEIVKSDTNYWEEQECLQWLDTQTPSSVLYISLGSVATLPIVQFHEVALGLIASRQPFLWAIRPTMYVNSVSELLPQGFQEQTEKQGMVISWAPQLSVLSHAATGGFLSHCGWNSTLESIITGVPILAFPNFGDQMTQARMVEDGWKVGLKVERGREGLVGREEVERKVQALMNGGEVRRRVEEVRVCARRAMGENGSSKKVLEGLVEAMLRRCSQGLSEWDQSQLHSPAV